MPFPANPAYSLIVASTAVTAECMRANISRTAGTRDRELATGTMMLVMDNVNGRYSPQNSGSLNYPGGLVGRQAKLTATFSAGTYALFTGYVKAVKIDPVLGARFATLECEDQTGRVLDAETSLPIAVLTNPGSIFTSVLSQCNVTSFGVDAFGDIVDYAWFERRKAGDILHQLAQEGAYWIYDDPDGVFRCRERFFNLGGTVVASINELLGLSYTISDSSIKNYIKTQGRTRAPSSLQAIAQVSGDSVTVAASSSAVVWVDYIDAITRETRVPCTDITTPVAGTHYALGTTQGGNELTSVSSFTISRFATSLKAAVYNGSGQPGYLSLDIKGRPLIELTPTAMETQNASSQAVYQLRALIQENSVLTREGYLRDYGIYLLGRYGDPRPAVTLTLKNQFPAILDADLGDMFHVTERITGLGERWTILGLSHIIDLASGLEHTAEYDVEKFDAAVGENIMRLDVGRLDVHRIGF